MKKRQIIKCLFFGIMSTTLFFNGCGKASTNSSEADNIENTSIESDTTNSTEIISSEGLNSTTGDDQSSENGQTTLTEGDDDLAYANFDFYQKVLTDFVNCEENSFYISDGAGASNYEYFKTLDTADGYYCCFSLMDLNQDGILELIVGENSYDDNSIMPYATAIFRGDQDSTIFYNMTGFDEAAGVFDYSDSLSEYRNELVGRYDGNNVVTLEELNYEDYDLDNECPINIYHLSPDGSKEYLTEEELNNYTFNYNFSKIKATYFITPENIQKIFEEKDFDGANGPR